MLVLGVLELVVDVVSLSMNVRVLDLVGELGGAPPAAARRGVVSVLVEEHILRVVAAPAHRRARALAAFPPKPAASCFWVSPFRLVVLLRRVARRVRRLGEAAFARRATAPPRAGPSPRPS